MKYNFGIDGDIGGWVYTKEYVRWKLSGTEGKPVTVRINSLGGRVDHALAIAQMFRDHGNITCVIVGMCASAATIIAMGAKNVIMDTNALFLAHKCLNVVDKYEMMNADDMRTFIEKLQKNVDDNDTIDRVIATMYANKSGLAIDRVLDIMKKGAWLDATTVGQLKLVDEVKDVGEKTNAKENFAQVQLAYGLPDLPEGKKWYQPLVNLFGRPLPIEEEPEPKQNQEPTAPAAAAESGTTQNQPTMKKTFATICAFLAVEALAFNEGKTTDLTEEQINSLEGEMARLQTEAGKVTALETEKSDLQNKLDELQKKYDALAKQPGDTTSEVKTEEKHGAVDLNDDAQAAKLAEALVNSLC